MPNELPVNTAEYNALTAGVGIVDLADRAHIELTGKDRASFLHGLCTNEVKKLSPGEGCEAFFTNVQGKTIGHGFIFCGTDSLTVETAPGQAAALVLHFDRYLIREDVQLHDRTAEWGELLIAGEKSLEFLRGLIDVALPDAPLRHGVGKIQGHDVRVVRSHFLRVPTFLLFASRDAIASLLPFLLQKGAVPCSSATLDCVRIESGSPVFGRDISASNLPQELARDKIAISFNKGCYLGQETVARIDALGHVNRALVGIRFADAAVPATGTELLIGEKSVGQVTSASYSPTLQAAIALGFVRRGQNSPGTELTADGKLANIVALPMVTT